MYLIGCDVWSKDIQTFNNTEILCNYCFSTSIAWDADSKLIFKQDSGIKLGSTTSKLFI